MSEIIKLVLEYKKSFSERIFEEILDILLPMMSNHLKKVPYSYKEDVMQELRIAIHSLAISFNINSFEMSKALFNEVNLKKLKDSKLNANDINLIFDNKYIKNFIKEIEQGEQLLLDAFENEFNFNTFNYNFSLFNAKNQFYYVLSLRFSSVVSEFFRKNYGYLNNEKLILNTTDSQGDELITFIQDESIITGDDFFIDDTICEEDKNFLKLFVENKKLLSQSDVSKKLGVSQQYISKRFIRIIGKYEIRL